MATIVLADDHPIVREGVRALLESVPDLQVVGEAADGLEALKLVQKESPDILILDLIMPGIDGLEVIRRVHEDYPRTHIVVLSARDEQDYVFQALKNGAMAYVVKYSTKAVLVQAIREALEGRNYCGPPMTADTIDLYRQNARNPACDPLTILTSREQEVMQLALAGLTNAEMADKLCVSITTIASHRANLMRKLGLHNQTELVRYAYSHGLWHVDE